MHTRGLLLFWSKDYFADKHTKTNEPELINNGTGHLKKMHNNLRLHPILIKHRDGKHILHIAILFSQLY